MKPLHSTLLLPLLAAGCASSDVPARPTATADLRNAAGQVLARATATDTAGGARIYVEAAGLQPGTYAVHVHTTGRCEGDFTGAGGHWNPTGSRHGSQNPAGPHLGDLPNINVGANGRGTIAYVIAGAQLLSGANSVLDADGAAVIVHAGPDDYRTDPSGNSGARIACGVLNVAG